MLALAFGAMIGWGWVVTTGLWITEAGSLGAILAFAIGGVLVVVVGLTYAELASALPLAGGEHVYTFKAMGRTASFIATWAIILGYVSVVAFEAVALPTVFEYLVPDYSQGYLYTIAGWDVTATWAGVGILGSILVAWVNYRGIKLTTAITFILTMLILGAGLLLITGSTVSGDIQHMQPLFEKGIAGVLTVIIMTPFMFVGFDVIPQAAEEINLPQRKIGQLLIAAVVLAVLWYVAIIFGVSRVLGSGELDASNLVTADAMAKAFGDSRMMGNILVLGGIGGIMTSWLGFYVGGSRAIFALARAGMLPKSLGELHPKYNTPHKAIVLIAVLSTAAPLLGRPALVWLVDAGGLGLVVAWLMVAISFVILRKKRSGNEASIQTFRRYDNWLGCHRYGVRCHGFIYAWYAIGAHLAVRVGYYRPVDYLGVVLYHVSLSKYGREYADKHMKEEIDKIA